MSRIKCNMPLITRAKPHTPLAVFAGQCLHLAAILHHTFLDLKFHWCLPVQNQYIATWKQNQQREKTSGSHVVAAEWVFVSMIPVISPQSSAMFGMERNSGFIYT